MSIDGEQQKKGSRSKIANYEKILSNNPRSFIFAQLAEEHIKMGDVDRAIEICKDGLQYNPDFSDGLYVLGVAYFKKDRKDEARNLFLKIVANHPDHYLAREALRRMGVTEADMDTVKESLATTVPNMDSEPIPHRELSESPGKTSEMSLEEMAIHREEKMEGIRSRSEQRAVPMAAGDIRGAQREGADASKLHDSSEFGLREKPSWLKPFLVLVLIAGLVGGFFGVRTYLHIQSRNEIAKQYIEADNLIKRDSYLEIREAVGRLEQNIANYPKALNLRALLVEAYSKLLLDFEPGNLDYQAQVETHFATFPSAESIKDSDMLTAQAYRAFFLTKFGDVRFLLDTAGEKGLLTPSGECLDGELHAYDRDYQGAIRLYDEALNDDPAQLRALYKKSEVLLELEDIAPAKIAIELLLEKSPKHERGRLLQAEIALNGGEGSAEVEKIIAPFEKRDINSLPTTSRARLLFLKASLANKRGETSPALEMARESVKLFPRPQSLFLLAQMQFDQKLYDAAKENALLAIEMRPRDKSFHAFLGRIYFLEGNKTEALSQMEMAIADATDRLDLLLMAGDAAADLRMFDKAVDYYERAARVNFQNLDLKKKLILTYIEKQELKEARRRIDRLLLDHDKDPVTYLLNGRYYLAEGKEVKAVKEFQRGLDLSPDDRDLLMEMVKLHIANGLDVRAVETLRKMEKLYPEDVEVLQLLAEISFGARAYSESGRLYRKLVKLQPATADYRLYLAYIDYVAGKQDAAMQVVSEEIARDDRNGLARIMRGAFKLLGDDFKKAEADIQRGIQLDSKNPEGHFWLGKIKLEMKDTTWAKNEFDITRECQPIYPLVEFEIGMIHFREGHFEQARQMFERALKVFELFPEETTHRVQIMLRLGEIEIMRNQTRVGLKLVEKASKLDPEAAEPYYILARHSNKFSNPKKALDLLKKAEKLDPELAAVYYERGLIYMARDRDKEALENFRTYLRMEPKGTYAEDARKHLEKLSPR